jgi:cytochrome c2
LQDQQLAGVIMWVPMGFAYVAAGAWAFLKWIETAAKRQAKFEAVLRQYRTVTSAVLMIVPILLFTCGQAEADPLSPKVATGGDPQRGAKLIQHYACGYCHTIPGIANANGRVGPPLSFFGERLYVAGMLPNTPDNLIAWIRDPQRIVPGNVMPVLGVSENDARDIAAYLYTLHR